MDESLLANITYALHVASSLMLGVVILWFDRSYHRAYLRWWAWGWLSNVLFLSGAMVSIALFPHFGASHPMRLAASYVTSAAGLSVVVCFVVGILILAERIQPNVPHRRTIWVGVGVLAAIVLVPFAAQAGASAVTGRMFFRVGIRAALAGGAFLIAAAVILRVSTQHRGLGRVLVVLALFGLGFSQTGTFVVHLLAFSSVIPHVPPATAYVGMAEFMVGILLGLGMVIWLLEEERARALRAADERELLQAQLNQSQKLESIGRLAGGVAHDFNNLLTAVVGNAELVEQWSDLTPRSAGALDQIKSAANRAAELTQQLLAFARKQPAEPTVVDLNQLITTARDLLTRVVREDIGIEVELAPYPVLVDVNRVQVEQVLMNLVVNARDAMPDGGTITIGTSREPDRTGIDGVEMCTMSITDRGTGIAEADLSQIFEPFFSTKSQAEGVGLGLATSYGIIARAGGRIEVTSEVGSGSTFRVMLPQSSRAAPAPNEWPENVTRGSTGVETVMVVEDDEQVRDLIQYILESDGYTLLVAEDGVEAMDVANRHDGDIDLLLTDTVMPRMGGVQLAAQMTETRPGLRVIYTSGYAGDSQVDMPGTGAAFLAKPFTPSTLSELVRTTLDAK